MTNDGRAMTLRLPTALHERLRQLAFDRHASISTLVIGFITEGLAKLDAKEHAMKEDATIRAKWVLDGSATLAEAAQKARDFAEELQALHDQGYLLREPIADDYGFYYKP